ncbi:hypothetical protein [Paenibacillus amylolyticus]|uniref:hypothetical protein n=1 Tax=Paenibacillus amylolyticus TaxID=1451 RepID=UPI003D9903CF
MSDKLQKYLAAGTEAAEPEQIEVPVDGEKWSVRRLTTIDIRRCYDVAFNDDGTAKETFNEIDAMIVRATEHDFPWNNKELLLAYKCTNKNELPARLLNDPDHYAVLSKAVRKFQETKDALLKEAKNSSGETAKQAG